MQSLTVRRLAAAAFLSLFAATGFAQAGEKKKEKAE